jgi:hypothetical protein
MKKDTVGQHVHESSMAQVNEMHAEHAKELPATTEVYEKMTHYPEQPPGELPGSEVELRDMPSPRR